MKNYKNVLLIVYIAIELVAIYLFIIDEISSTVFFLIAIAMALMIGLYFFNRHKTISN